MIEVLVSVFVLALGVVGAAGMQLIALRTGQQSSIQSTATQLATEMADKMRANAAQMNVSDAVNLFLAVDYDSSAGTLSPPAKLCYTTASCSAAELAAHDIYEWEKRIQQTLPSGRVKICRDSAPATLVAGVLSWSCTAYAGSVVNNAPMVIKVGWHGKDKDSTTVLPNVFVTVESYIK